MPVGVSTATVEPAAPRLRPRRLHAARMTVIAIIVGAMVTGMLMWWSSGREAAADRERLVNSGELLMRETEHLFAQVSTQMTGLAGLFHANEVVPLAGFSTFVGDMGPVPGMVGMGYAQVVSSDHLDDWLAAARRKVPDLMVHDLDADGQPAAAGSQQLLFPILYFEPAERSMMGLDLGSVPAWRDQVIERLPVETLATTGFLGADYPAPLGGSQRILVARAIIDPGSTSMHDFVVAILDVEELVGENAAEIVDGISWSVAEAAGSSATAASDAAVWQGMFAFGGRTWTLSVHDGDGSGPWLRGITLFTLIMGLAITGLVSLVVFLVIGRIEVRSEVEVLESVSAGKDGFLAAVSHRLRTPLTAVVGFSEVLRDSAEVLSDSDRRELLSTIAVQATELGHLFDNLLTVTRESERSTFIAARVNLETETQRVLETAEPMRRAKTRIVASENDAIAAGDPALVRQILRNLLTNATDFGDRVEIEVAKSGIVARVSVRDNGPGIPPDRVADAFVLYGSHGEIGQPDSMGVGLYVSRRLARRMSGDLVYRRSGGWTVFELTIPALPATVVVQPAAETTSAARL